MLKKRNFRFDHLENERSVIKMIMKQKRERREMCDWRAAIEAIMEMREEKNFSNRAWTNLNSIRECQKTLQMDLVAFYDLSRHPKKPSKKFHCFIVLGKI